MNRRHVLKTSIRSAAALALADGLTGPRANAQVTSQQAVALLSEPLTLTGTLLPAAQLDLANQGLFLLATDRTTAFEPVYISNADKTLNPFVGATVAIPGRLTNIAPALILVPEGPPQQTPPKAIPDFEATLDDIPLTELEFATVQALFRTVVNAIFKNPDPLYTELFNDQIAQALAHADFANEVQQLPFIAFDDPVSGLRNLSFRELVDLVNSPEFAPSGGGGAVVPPAIGTADKLDKILLAIFLFVIGFLLVKIGKKTAQAVAAAVKDLIANPIVRLSLELLFMAIQAFLGGKLSLDSFLGSLKDAIVAIGGQMGSVLLSVLKTLKWWEYVAAIASAAFVYLKAAKAIANAAAFISELAAIVQDP